MRWLQPCTTRQESCVLAAVAQVVAALQAACVRYRLNVALDGPVVVDVGLAQRQVRSSLVLHVV